MSKVHVSRKRGVGLSAFSLSAAGEPAWPWNSCDYSLPVLGRCPATHGDLKLEVSAPSRPAAVGYVVAVLLLCTVVGVVDALIRSEWASAAIASVVTGWLLWSLWNGRELARDLLLFGSAVATLVVLLSLVFVFGGTLTGVTMGPVTVTSPVAMALLLVAFGVMSVALWRTLRAADVRAYFTDGRV